MKDNKKSAVICIGIGILLLLVFVTDMQNPLDCNKIKNEIPRKACHSFDVVPYLPSIGSVYFFGLAVVFLITKDSVNTTSKPSTEMKK